MLTSRQPGSGTPSTGIGVRLGSRFILAFQALEHRSSLIGVIANSNPPCSTEARLVASHSGASSGAAANAHGGGWQWLSKSRERKNEMERQGNVE
uniref:Uncharacterized protein n=1 Tax=Oryza punctata TaxID=4537 RepID=A0A0E0LIR0_ORYPU